jgi:CheY-like chemotaxis protein
VLVVDDSAVDRRLVAGLLRNAGNWQIRLAESAEQALGQLAVSPVDLVLTDLRMPGMDGLALLKAIRLQYANLPVVLMTAEGSEELAVEALRHGAASYVPKPQLAAMLVEVLEDVLGLVRADRAHGELVQCMVRNEFTFTLPCEPTLLGPLVDLVQQMLAAARLCDATGRMRVAMALEQALLNALFRGNLELRPEALARGDASLVEDRRSQPPYCDRKLHVDVSITPEAARFVVRDEGPGFDTSTLANHKSETLEREAGRGIVLMQSFMDEVRYNQQGNEVTLVKRREAQPQQAPPAIAAPAPAAVAAPVRAPAATAGPPRPTRWGEVPTGSRVTDSISGRTYRVHRGDTVVTLSAPGGDTLMFGLDDGIDTARYRVYML